MQVSIRLASLPPPVASNASVADVFFKAAVSSSMKAGDVVVIDAAAEYSMYAADITRTLPIGGHFSARQREIYEIVLGAQEAAMAAFQSGKMTLSGGENSATNA